MKFEEAIKELEKVVANLESGENGLDESIELFEKGIKLSKECQKMLDTAEKKVRVLLADGSETDFAEDKE
ncbi:MAG: exodeoxyribonuclease VII small subunit [Eubacteriales bacterium]|nr:exodeoxyribonuclease VII small subunit [Eubacteriales bacterium]